MSSAYGHRIFPMGTVPLGEAAYLARDTMRIPRRSGFNGRVFWSPGCRCGGKRCGAEPKFVTQYWYVTGRAGRVTDRVQWQCPEHAARFCRTHDLQLPALGEVAA